MTNLNGSKTIQVSDDLAKRIAVLAINKGKTRREIADKALEEYLIKNENK